MGELDAVHNILKKAMLAAPDEPWPARPHFGGALPVMSTRTQLAVALELVDEAARHFPPPDRAAFAALRTAATRVLVDGAQPPRKELDAISKRAKKDAPAIRVAKYAVRTAGNFLYSPPGARNAVGANVDAAAVAIVEALLETDRAAVAPFLVWLDNLVLCHHLMQQLAERDVAPTAPIAAVIARTPGAVLALLADDRYGLYCKLRQRWQWHEGDRATMFATVPDDFMSDVAADLERADAAATALPRRRAPRTPDP